MNKYFYMLSLVALVGLGACGGEGNEAEVTEEPQPYQDPMAPVEVDPAVTEGAIIMDTSAVGTPVDPVADTAR